MTYQELVSEIRGIFMQADVSGIKEHIAYQFNIQGEAEGAFYAEVLEGKLYIEPYEYYDRDVLFTTTADTLLSIAGGTMDAVAAFTLGKLQVEGSFDKALLLQSFSKQAGREKKKQMKAEEKRPQKAEEKESQKAVEKESQKAVEKVAQKTEEKTAKKTVRRLLKK
ncbi:SCP2 sterol-binding domain-containing protein [Blautia producta]|uniref:SCP2 sterol-binding domain-containing protein n=1 Tax=Blautia producta TaxID=33035 RepID=UPI00210F115C|nr:SCP2 sterol-binding domain-containing protein [Blautia producta]MCQ4744809.1 SCP2 sterol-binding domain-containing protein [Blautia producta]